MLAEEITPAIRAALAEDVRLHARGADEAQIEVPFYFADGDGLVLYVRRLPDGSYEVTDKAHTFLHLSYHLDISRLRSGTRADVLEQIERRHHIEDRDGELVRHASGQKDLGEAVFGFVQALLQISDIRLLERDIVRSTFRDDLEQVLLNDFPDTIRNYVDTLHDPEGHYPIDYFLDTVPRPIALFGVPTEDSALRAIVIADRFVAWKHRLLFVAVEDEQRKLTRNTVAWLSDTFDKQFPTLHGNEDVLVRYLKAELDFERSLLRADSPEVDSAERDPPKRDPSGGFGIT